MHNFAKIAQHVTRDEDGGYLLSIAVNEVWNGVRVESVTMHVAQYDGDDDDYDGDDYDGDMAVNWDATGLQNSGGGDMGSLLMRGWNDEVGKVMRRFYSDEEFDEDVAAVLHEAGFGEVGFGGSEWGMQDEGRASYDAHDVADAVRAAMAAQ